MCALTPAPALSGRGTTAAARPSRPTLTGPPR